jgi:hypothetical protein
MKATLRISICLNLLLGGGAIFLLADRRKEVVVPAPAPAETAVTQAVNLPAPAPSVVEQEPFSWRQLESPKSYRTYIANLRAIGCPEPTIQDIVRGDTGRAYAYERRQLGLNGTGSGPWSQSQETQLEARLLGTQPPVAETVEPAQGDGDSSTDVSAETAAAPAQNTKAAPAYPLFLQNVNWSALGFTADQQATIEQVRQQYLDQINSQNQPADNSGNLNSSSSPNPGSGNQANPNSTGSTSPTTSQTPLQAANGQLRDLLGAQGYAAYEQQQYYMWYQPQVMANVGGGNLTINPDAFVMK